MSNDFQEDVWMWYCRVTAVVVTAVAAAILAHLVLP
jgi:hypothetical protein